MKIEKNRYAIFVLFLQFGSTIKHSFTIVWSENTTTSKKQKEKVNMKDKKKQKKIHCKLYAYTCKYLNGNISLTGFAEGMSINNEFEKNSNLLLASRFFGTLAAESFTVRRRCNLFTSSFYNKKEKKYFNVFKQEKKKMNCMQIEGTYNLRIIRPYYPRKKTSLIPSSS